MAITAFTRRSLLAGLALGLISAIYLLRIQSGMADFAVNYRAGQRLAAGESLYQTADGHFMFKYLPSSALLYLPLTVVPLEVAKPLWFALSVGALVATFRLTRRLVGGGPARALTVLPGLVLAKYFLHELRLGQINILVTLVMTMAAGALDRAAQEGRDTGRVRHRLVAGALAGLSAALKPYAALLFPYLVLKREWSSTAAGLVVLTLAAASGTLFYGPAGNLDVLRQWGVTLSQSTPELLTNNDNVSIVAFFTKWTGDAALAARLTALVLAVLALLMLGVVARGAGLARAVVLETAMLLTLIPLVSPLGWDYTFLMSLLAVTLIVRHFGEFGAVARGLLAANFAMIGLAVYDLMGQAWYATFMQWSVTTVNFVLIVVALAYLRLRRVC